MKVVYTLNALIDLDQIREYIAERADQDTAVRFIEQMEAAIDNTLSVFPCGGSTRDDLPEGVRLFRHKTYVALYSVEDDDDLVVIEAVRRGSRDRGDMFKQ